MRSRHTLVISAVLVLCAWMFVVVAATLWKHPQFWIGPDERFSRAQRLFEQGHQAPAFAELDLALAADPANAGYHVFKGYRQLDREDATGAETSFRAALRTSPADTEARLGLARSLVLQGRRREALAELEGVPATDMTPDQIRRRSQLYGSLDASGPALSDLSHLLHSGSANPELLREATGHALRLQDWPRVLTLTDWLLSATADRDLRRWAGSQRARALQAQGQSERAYEQYRLADQAGDLEQRAELARRLERHAEAARLYGELADRHRDEPRFARMRAFALLEAGRREEAEAAFRRLLQEGTADRHIRVAYAWMLNVQHRYAEAWLVVDPLPKPARDASLLELQARTALWAGHYAEAVHLLRALLRVRPHEPQLWTDLAAAAQAIGDEGAAADALAAYLRLISDDAAARQRLAEMLARSGSVDAAIDEYRRLLADDPSNVELAMALGLLYETSGELEAAKATYLQVDRRGAAAPELHLRLARLHRWTGEPQAAVSRYERYLTVVTDEDLARRARSELALALLDAGEPARSLAALQSLAETGGVEGQALITAARAATATGRPDLAVRFLEFLAAERPLSLEEQVWLAGQYRAAGRDESALATYERALAGGRSEPLVLEAIADLRFGRRDYAGAIAALQQIDAADRVRLKLARAAAANGELALAADAYERHAAAHPEDPEAQLEAARFFAASGDARQAIAYYVRAIGFRGAADLRLELARIHLADGRFAAAEDWARQALAAGEDVHDARLALGQALHLQGRSAAAEVVLREALEAGAAEPGVRLWRGQVAVALDRHLTAYQELSAALVDGGDGGERVALWMSAAARKRGDYNRALRAVERAAALRAEAPQIAAARLELARASAPSFSLPAWTHQDSNGLRLQQAGVGVRLFLPRLTGSLSVDATSGRLAQGALDTSYTSALMTLAQVFPNPQLELGAGVGLHRFSSAPDLLSWRGTATWHVNDDTRAALSVGRRPVLPLAGPAPLRAFNRVLDAARTGPDFFSDGLQAFAEFLTRPAHRAQLGAGVERLRDANRQLWLYGHYQMELASAARQWVVLRPNVYYETFQRKDAAYFSPERHLTVGTMLHTVRRYPHWDVELEVNPQLLRTDGATGWAGHGVLNLNVQAGRARIGAGTFVFYDGLEDYLQWRFGARVTLPIGK